MFEALKQKWAINVLDKARQNKEILIATWVTGFKYRPFDKDLELLILSHPILPLIRWPSHEGLDNWNVLQYLEIINSFCRLFAGAGCGKPRFEVCVFNDLEKLGCFRINPITAPVKEQLRTVHMWYLENIPPHLLAQIPDMMNFIFSEGGEIINSEAERVTPNPKELTQLTNFGE